jgi:hypothetical protein
MSNIVSEPHNTITITPEHTIVNGDNIIDELQYTEPPHFESITSISSNNEDITSSDDENCSIPYCPKCGSCKLRRTSSPTPLIHVFTPSSSHFKGSLKTRSQSSLTLRDKKSPDVILFGDLITSDESKVNSASKSTPNFKYDRKISESQKKLMRSDSSEKIAAIEDEIHIREMTRSQKLRSISETRLRTASNPNLICDIKAQSLFSSDGIPDRSELTTIDDSIDATQVCIKKLNKQRFREIIQKK